MYTFGRVVKQAGAAPVIVSFSPSADGSFVVSSNVLVTKAGNAPYAFAVACAYTDEGGTARTKNLPHVLDAGEGLVTSVAKGNGAAPYHGVASQIRAKAGSTIVVGTSGNFPASGLEYNVEVLITQVA